VQAAALFVYGFVSNVALAVLPHEPAVIWYGARLGVWPTALIATAGTLAAALVDHRLFVPLIGRLARRQAARCPSESADPGPAARVARVLARFFTRAPFAILALSGLTPLPFFPFKALAFTTGYPMGRYLAAVAARCLPRYALLAWLGVAVRLPTWLIAGLFLALMIPSLRILRWPRPSAS
jgi:membrane protein YqaA with SNARE-associated domain